MMEIDECVVMNKGESRCGLGMSKGRMEGLGYRDELDKEEGGRYWV